MKKFINLDFSCHQRASKLESGTEANRQTQLFQKYFPKYFKKFPCVSKNISILSKVKRVKIIQNLDASQPLWRSKNWRTLLINKAKGVRILNSSNHTFFQFPEKLKLLYNLHTVNIAMPRVVTTAFPRTVPVPEKKLGLYSDKSCRMMGRMRKLKCVKISKLATNHKDLLIYLNKSSPRFLSSLEKFSLFWGEELTPTSNYNLLYAMPNHKNLSKYATHLDLGTLCYDAHFFNFKYLASSVPDLLKLSFKYAPPKFPSKNSRSNIEALEKLKNLRSLDIVIANLFSFLKDFTTPCGIQNLKLTFEECFSKEVMLELDKNFIEARDCGEFEILRIFEESEVFEGFCKYLQRLKNIKTLEIIWKWDSNMNTYIYQSYFLQEMLKQILCLENLSIRMISSSKINQSIQDSYLPQFFESCLFSSQTLETLELGHESIEFTQFDLSDLRKKFPRLSQIKIIGRFNQDNDLYLLLKQLILLGDGIVKIKLQAAITENIGSLVPFFDQINQLEKPRKVMIEVQIKYQGDWEDILLKMLEDSDKGYSASEGINFKILTNGFMKGQTLKLRQECREKFKNCDIFDLEDFY